MAQTPPGKDAATSSQDLRGLNTAYIDKSADPCQDFFQYACGKFSSLHPIPPDRSSFGNMSMLSDENEKILHAILDKASAKVRAGRRTSRRSATSTPPAWIRRRSTGTD